MIAKNQSAAFFQGRRFGPLATQATATERVIVAAFGPAGPMKCSGLDVVCYDADALHDEFGGGFRLVKHMTELHRTPAGAIQQFTYCFCRLAAA